jgi:hypothetical protein
MPAPWPVCWSWPGCLRNLSFSSRVILAAYTLEEPPFFGTDIMGSALHARSLKEQGADVRLMICLEMIGCFTDEPGSQKFPLPFLSLYYPTTGNFIGIVDKLFSTQAGRMKRWMRSATDLPVYSINAPAWVPGVDWSDHSSFWKQGYPAVMVTDTAFYRYDAYHTAADTPDRLDYAAMAKVVQGVYGYVMKLASVSEREYENATTVKQGIFHAAICAGPRFRPSGFPVIWPASPRMIRPAKRIRPTRT